MRSRRFSDKGRIALIAVAVIVVGLLLFGRFFAGFYTDYLWFDSVGRAGVFSTMLRSKLLMFFLFGGTFVALAILNLVIADRLAPSAFSANTHPVVERFHEFFGHRLRSLRIAVATVAGVLFAAPAVGHWQDWLMFRNSQRFGIADAQFRHDVGFYMFRLPFIAFVLDWLFAALVFITLLVIATHVLSGGIIIQPPRPKVRRATKAHVAVLLAALAVVKAGDYWLTRYELTTDSRGFVRGLLYSAAKAQLPAVMLLTLIALLVAGLFLSTLRTNSWRIPVVASALWAVIALIGGVIYPAAIQALVVNPNQRDKEAPYIVRNIDATLHALGIDNVARKQVSFADISEKALEADITPLKNVRLLKPEAMVGRFRTDQSQKAGLTINDVDPDRYDLDGRVQQVSMAARELDLSAIANKSWQGQHLINTHGCGLVEAPSGQISDRRPVYREVPARPTGDVLQRRHLGICDCRHGRQRRGLPRPRRPRPVQRNRRHQARLGLQAHGVRAQLPRLQHDRFGSDQRLVTPGIDPACRGSGQEACTIPVIRQRSLSRGTQRPGAVGDRRVHDLRSLSLWRER